MTIGTLRNVCVGLDQHNTFETAHTVEDEALELEACSLIEKTKTHLQEYKADLARVSDDTIVDLLKTGGWQEEKAKEWAGDRLGVLRTHCGKVEALVLAIDIHLALRKRMLRREEPERRGMWKLSMTRFWSMSK